MDARFRIRTEDGQLLEPKTVEIFGELVRSGMIHPGDQVFDALTECWVPAARHPMVALFKDPLTGDQGDPFALDLVEPPEESPEEAQRAFIERMAEERRQDPDRPELSDELPLVSSSSPAVALAPVVEGGGEHVLDVPPSPGAWGARPHRSATARPSRAWKSAAAVLMVVVPVSVVVVSARAARSRPDFGKAEATVAEASEARAMRPVPHTEAQIREQAYAGFVSDVEALQSEFGLGAVPDAWLEGYYLADPVGYPEVRVFWQQYLALVDRARDSEASFYRVAYLDAATRAGISGPVRSLRLAAAAGDFEAAWTARDTHYGQVRELAAAALALDDLCRKLNGRITYEPIRGERVSADPVIEAAGTDPEAQAQLEAALDRVLGALHGPNGEGAGDRDRVPQWLVDGLKGLK